MLKEVIIFTGGIIVGAIGAAYCAGVEAGREEAIANNSTPVDYEDDSENFQKI